MPDNKELLWQTLKGKELYSKDYPAFQEQFATPEKQELLRKVLVEKQLYSKDSVSFQNQFFNGTEKKREPGSVTTSFDPLTPIEGKPPEQPVEGPIGTGEIQAQQEGVSEEKQVKEEFIQRVNPDEQGRFSSTLGAINQQYYGLPGSLLKEIAIGGSKIGSIGQDKDLNAQDNPLYKVGQWYQDQIKVIAPRNKKYQGELQESVGQAVGDLAALVTGGGITRAATKVPQMLKLAKMHGISVVEAAKGVAKGIISPEGIIGATQMGVGEYEQAKEGGATDAEAFDLFIKNAAVGSVLERMPVQLFWRRLDDVTGGGVVHLLKKGFSGGMEEGITEILQQAYSNHQAKQVYDKTRTIIDGMGEAGGIGFGLGFVLNAMGVRLRGIKPKTKAEQKYIDDALKLVTDKKQFVEAEAEAIPDTKPDEEVIPEQPDPTPEAPDAGVIPDAEPIGTDPAPTPPVAPEGEVQPDPAPVESGVKPLLPFKEGDVLVDPKNPEAEFTLVKNSDGEIHLQNKFGEIQKWSTTGKNPSPEQYLKDSFKDMVRKADLPPVEPEVKPETPVEPEVQPEPPSKEITSEDRKKLEKDLKTILTDPKGKPVTEVELIKQAWGEVEGRIQESKLPNWKQQEAIQFLNKNKNNGDELVTAIDKVESKYKIEINPTASDWMFKESLRHQIRKKLGGEVQPETPVVEPEPQPKEVINYSGVDIPVTAQYENVDEAHEKTVMGDPGWVQIAAIGDAKNGNNVHADVIAKYKEVRLIGFTDHKGKQGYWLQGKGRIKKGDTPVEPEVKPTGAKPVDITKSLVDHLGKAGINTSVMSRNTIKGVEGPAIESIKKWEKDTGFKYSDVVAIKEQTIELDKEFVSLKGAPDDLYRAEVIKGDNGGLEVKLDPVKGGDPVRLKDFEAINQIKSGEVNIEKGRKLTEKYPNLKELEGPLPRRVPAKADKIDLTEASGEINPQPIPQPKSKGKLKPKEGKFPFEAAFLKKGDVFEYKGPQDLSAKRYKVTRSIGDRNTITAEPIDGGKAIEINHDEKLKKINTVDVVDQALTPVLSKDELRPNMTGVYYDVENKQRVATNGHALVVIPDSKLKGENRIVHPNGRIIDEPYPAYLQVIPEENTHVIKGVDAVEVLAKAEGIVKANKFLTNVRNTTVIKGVLEFEDGTPLGWDPEYMKAGLAALVETGTKKVNIEATAENRAIIIKDADNPKKFALVMPIMLENTTDLNDIPFVFSKLVDSTLKDVTKPKPKPKGHKSKDFYKKGESITLDEKGLEDLGIYNGKPNPHLFKPDGFFSKVEKDSRGIKVVVASEENSQGAIDNIKRYGKILKSKVISDTGAALQATLDLYREAKALAKTQGADRKKKFAAEMAKFKSRTPKDYGDVFTGLSDILNKLTDKTQSDLQQDKYINDLIFKIKDSTHEIADIIAKEYKGSEDIYETSRKLDEKYGSKEIDQLPAPPAKPKTWRDFISYNQTQDISKRLQGLSQTELQAEIDKAMKTIEHGMEPQDKKTRARNTVREAGLLLEAHKKADEANATPEPAPVKQEIDLVQKTKLQEDKKKVEDEMQQAIDEVQGKVAVEEVEFIPVAQLKGKEVKMEVEIEETLETETMVLPALEVQNDIKKRQSILKQLTDCVG